MIEKENLNSNLLSDLQMNVKELHETSIKNKTILHFSKHVQNALDTHAARATAALDAHAARAVTARQSFQHNLIDLFNASFTQNLKEISAEKEQSEKLIQKDNVQQILKVKKKKKKKKKERKNNNNNHNYNNTI